MRQVLDPWLWQGHAGDLLQRGLLESHGIDAVLQVAMEEQLPTLSREILHCHVPIIDGAGADLAFMKAAIQLAFSLVQADKRVLVCCSAGMSRSPAICAGVVALLNRCSPAEALTVTIQDGPADVSSALWDVAISATKDLQAPGPGGNQPDSIRGAAES